MSRLFMAAALLAAAIPAAAHTFHQSRAEINYNTGASTIEVILQIHIDDLEEHLTRKLGRQVDLGAMPDARPAVEPYVRRAFMLFDQEGEAVELMWIGAEVSRHFIDIYLEAPAGARPETLRNRIMVPEYSDQRNIVNLRRDNRTPGRTTTLTASRTETPLEY